MGARSLLRAHSPGAGEAGHVWTSMFSPARHTRRPMRPKPEMPMLTILKENASYEFCDAFGVPRAV